MFERFSRSWALCKLSFRVIRADKETLLFPLVGIVLALGHAAATLWLPVSYFIHYQFEHMGQPSSYEPRPLDYALVVLMSFGLHYINAFTDTCISYTARVRFAGGNATFFESVRFALARSGKLLAWSLMALSFGLLLAALDRAAQKLRNLGGRALELLGGLLDTMWSIATLFVIPAMVYEPVGPYDAIKRSTQVLRRTWGESLIRHYGMGWLSFLAMLPGVALIMVPFGAPSALAGVVPYFFVAGVAWFIIVAMVFGVANVIFNTALYEYATTRKLPGGFPREVMQEAFSRRGG